MEFVWDDRKNVSNYRKHGIWFEEAVSVFDDRLAREIPDDDHSQQEERWIILGMSSELNVLVVVYAEKIDGELIRIISARPATRHEEDEYTRRKK
jgi:uncharacterized DUF497 family protein